VFEESVRWTVWVSGRLKCELGEGTEDGLELGKMVGFKCSV